MIQASELRIGNVLNHADLGYLFVVTIEKNIEQNCVVGINDNLDLLGYDMISLNKLKPVELTEEILLKCGFARTKVPMKSDIEYIDYRMGQFVLFILPKGIVEVEFCAAHNTIEERGYLREVKYLYQLQNLYFALTGQELNTSGL